MKPLAAELLILIADHSEVAHDGVCWVPPGGYKESWSNTLGRNVYIDGAGVASALRGLERRGLIAFTHLTKYSARITEDGLLLIESWCQSNSWPVQVGV